MTRKQIIKKLDAATAELVFLLCGGRCFLCGRATGSAGDPAHLFSRTNFSTRWDPDNVKLICRDCHRKSHSSDPGCYERKFIEVFGQKEYDKLRRKANTVVHLTDTDLKRKLVDILVKIRRVFGDRYTPRAAGRGKTVPFSVIDALRKERC